MKKNAYVNLCIFLVHRAQLSCSKMSLEDSDIQNAVDLSSFVELYGTLISEPSASIPSNSLDSWILL